MAATVVEKFHGRPPLDVKHFRGNIGTYAAGGVLLGPAETGFRVVHTVIVSSGADATRRYGYDTTTNKVVAYVTSTGAEVGAVDLSAVVLDFLVFGYN
jgi:hypothetical protein